MLSTAQMQTKAEIPSQRKKTTKKNQNKKTQTKPVSPVYTPESKE